MTEEIITLYDEDNEPAGFRVLHTLTMDNNEYILVQEIENSHANALILKRNGNYFAGIQELEEYNIVSDLFTEKYDTLDIEDETPL